MAIDPRKLKDFQKDLDEKSKGGGDNFINASKIEGTLDVRILDPLPNMDGLYSLEVPVWWIGKTKIISPEIFGEVDIIQKVITDAEAAALLPNGAELDKLLNAKNEWGQPKLRKQIEYWIPILAFDWQIDKDDQIIGIWGEDDKPDVALIEGFIRDKSAKVLNCKTQLMKAINHEATTRGGHIMFDPEAGFNLILGKSGSGRETKYSASKADYLPMPAKYYGVGTPDLVNICKAALFTDEYMDRVIGNYLYGEELPEKNDAAYRHPDVKAALKKDAPVAEAAPPARARPGADQPATPAETTPGPKADPAVTEPAAEPAAASPARPGRPGRPATAADTKAAARPARGAAAGRGSKRNVAEDLAAVKDD